MARAVAALPQTVDVILVHDAARPLLTDAIIERVVDGVAEGVGAVAGRPATDTFKRVDEAGLIESTPPRQGLWHAQTPQGFPAALLRRAVAALDHDPSLAGRATDDAALVESVGGRVRMVLGAARNLKVTHPTDVPLARWYLEHPSEGAE